MLFAVVGMAALFTSIVRAPLTGIVLILEMTSSYPLMLPLLAACFIAYALADLLHDRPIYEALLERDLVRGQTREAAQGGGRRSSRFWSRPVRRSTAAASATSACRQVVY